MLRCFLDRILLSLKIIPQRSKKSKCGKSVNAYISVRGKQYLYAFQHSKTIIRRIS